MVHNGLKPIRNYTSNRDMPLCPIRDDVNAPGTFVDGMIIIFPWVYHTVYQMRT